MLESEFKSKLKKDLKKMFPGSIIIEPNPNDIQGIPDLVIFYKNKWASLECILSRWQKNIMLMNMQLNI